MSKVVVIGAGASGIIASLKASKNNQVIILDSNDKCGKKILLTGNGRCNYWNSDLNIENYESDNKEALGKIISKENTQEVFEFLYNIGLYPKIKNGYYYPYSNQASSVREIFQKELENSNIKFITNFKVKDILKSGNGFNIISTSGNIVKADKVIIATGSKSFPKTGSDGSGYYLAEKLGHKVNPVYPALTSLKSSTKNDWENIRCDAKVSLFIDDKKVKEDIGEIQLTKTGISGICVFNISGVASKKIGISNKVEVSINFLPYLESDFYTWFDCRNKKIRNKTIEELLESIFNYKLIFLLLKKSNISREARWEDLSEKEKRNLSEQIENFRLKIVDTESFEKSQVCTGGISLNEINPITMESNIVPNLYFSGEILDVDGKCGGFNLAFAFISGYLAGRSI